MNRPPHDPAPVDEVAWLAQEQALADPGCRADALLAQALRSVPGSEPPPGFASDIARRVRASAAGDAGQARAERVERALLATLLLAMATAVGVMLAWYGPHWWSLLQVVLGEGATPWALAGAACLLLSWLPECARRPRPAGAAPV